tara:strand:+ start:1832 stop:2296 length:465 start_codon:yes stop_codon:yes gene_type:complete
MAKVKIKKSYLIALALVMVVVGGFFLFNTKSVDGVPLTMYKSPTCGCCIGNSQILSAEGFDVKTVSQSNMDIIKSQYQIPAEMQSCHTSVIDDYFIEGHVPMEAIEKLMNEKPDIDGIALPRMPSGSPGMPGVKTETWIIYSLKDGQYEEFMRV